MSTLLTLDSTTIANAPSHDFTVNFNNELQFPGPHELTLLRVNLWYSWFNIDPQFSNQDLQYSRDGGGTQRPLITISPGQYTIEDINEFLHKEMESNGDFIINPQGVKQFGINIEANFNTLRTRVVIDNLLIPADTYELSLTSAISNLHLLLGFDSQVITATKEGENLANINNDVNTLLVDTDIISGSFQNNQARGIINQFVPDVPPGSNIDVEPTHKVFLPLNRNRVDKIRMRIIDNLGRLVDLNDEPVTYSLQIRKTKRILQDG